MSLKPALERDALTSVGADDQSHSMNRTSTITVGRVLVVSIGLICQIYMSDPHGSNTYRLVHALLLVILYCYLWRASQVRESKPFEYDPGKIF